MSFADYLIIMYPLLADFVSGCWGFMDPGFIDDFDPEEREYSSSYIYMHIYNTVLSRFVNPQVLH